MTRGRLPLSVPPMPGLPFAFSAALFREPFFTPRTRGTDLVSVLTGRDCFCLARGERLVVLDRETEPALVVGVGPGTLRRNLGFVVFFFDTPILALILASCFLIKLRTDMSRNRLHAALAGEKRRRRHDRIAHTKASAGARAAQN